MQETIASTVPWHPDRKRIMQGIEKAKSEIIGTDDCEAYERGSSILREIAHDPVYNEDSAFGFHFEQALKIMQTTHKPTCPDFFNRHTLYTVDL